MRAAYRIYLRSIRLGQTDDEPMGVFVNKHGQLKYLTAAKIAEVLQKVTRLAHPDWTDNEVLKISSHSGRVFALMLLYEAGMSPDFCKKRLRWEGDSYRLYLRDTAAVQEKHAKALRKSSDLVTKILSTNRSVLPGIVLLDDNVVLYTEGHINSSNYFTDSFRFTFFPLRK